MQNDYQANRPTYTLGTNLMHYFTVIVLEFQHFYFHLWTFQTFICNFVQILCDVILSLMYAIVHFWRDQRLYILYSQPTQHHRKSSIVSNSATVHLERHLEIITVVAQLIHQNLPGIIPKSNISLAQQRPKGLSNISPQLFYPTVIKSVSKLASCR